MQAFHGLQNVLQGKMEQLIPNNHASTVKDTGYELPNCLWLQKKKDLEAARAAS